ncbi:helix-turn-helix domain-containing protein [Thermomonospora umbrina]|uniref:Helix-turn-helix protein n=1 Tax=Thermomonospora umbrina TaxID=111806 RepID=A0A3D9SXI9_9ACTN|nr:helix-turn-helix transcriptional regulator [Thermomonospora umbrina]REF00670.1 helix-turn-helix protein [Thermomonospora umbrina]
MTIRRLLGSRLREIREGAWFTLEAAASALGVPSKRLEGVEAGRLLPTLTQIIGLCDLFGYDDVCDRALLLTLGRQARRPNWWDDYADVLDVCEAGYLEAEQVATEIRSYHLLAVPPLLQTADYADALLAVRHGDGGHLRRAELLERRQRILRGDRLPAVWALVDEMALRRAVGGPDVMRRQLQHLADLCALPHVTLQICLMTDVEHCPPGGPIILLRMPGRLTDVVYLEYAVGGHWPKDVPAHRRLLDRAAVAAPPPDHTPDLLLRIAKEL